MTGHEYLTSLMRHMSWADSTVWKAVLASPAATADAKICDTFYHVHLVQQIFRQAWSGERPHVRDRKEFASADALHALGREAHVAIAKYLPGVSEADLDREFRMPWAIEFEKRALLPAQQHTLGESVVQVAMHTAHHRGQTCARLRELGAEPPTIDFIAWLWGGRPVMHL